jgi:hypothetical protein
MYKRLAKHYGLCSPTSLEPAQRLNARPRSAIRQSLFSAAISNDSARVIALHELFLRTVIFGLGCENRRALKVPCVSRSQEMRQADETARDWGEKATDGTNRGALQITSDGTLCRRLGCPKKITNQVLISITLV